MLLFREMETADLDTVEIIEQQASVSPWCLTTLQQCLISNNNEALVAELKVPKQSSQVIAFAFVASVLDESSLLNLCVSKDQQSKGYGKIFLDYLLQHAKLSEKTKYFLEVRASNHQAIKLYEKSGFKKDGLRKAYYSSKTGREDALTYSCLLSTVLPASQAPL